jgi:hypothetical protein
MSNTNKVVMNLISNKMENKKYHTSRTVTKSNNEKQKNTTLPEQSQNPIMKNKKIPHFQNSLIVGVFFFFFFGFCDCSGSVVFFCFSLLDFVTVLEVWYFFVFHYWIL